MSNPAILIIGGTGHLGKETIIALTKDSRSGNFKLQAGVKFTSLSASQQRDNMLDCFGVDSVTCDLDYPETVERACAGASKVFLILGNNEKRVEHLQNTLEALKKSKVDQFLFLSAIGCDSRSTAFARQFRECEDLVQGSGLNWTILRSAFFQENLLVFGDQIAEGLLRLSIGSGQIAPISLADIGEIVSNIFFDSDCKKYSHRTLHLTGSELFSGEQMAQVLSKIVGKEVHYVSPSADEMKHFYLGTGLCDWEANGLTELLESFSRNESNLVSEDSAMILGRPPTSLESSLHQHKDRFVTIRMIKSND